MFKVLISQQANGKPTSVFETQDQALMERVKHAIDKAATVRRVNRIV